MTPISVKINRKNIPAGVHFNDSKKGDSKRTREHCPKKKSRPKRSKTLEGETTTDGTSGSDPALIRRKPTPRERSYLSSSSSDSSDSTSTSSDVPLHPKPPKSKGEPNEANEEEKKCKLEKILKRVKIESPSVYNGKADLDVFDGWATEVKDWLDLNQVPEDVAITLLKRSSQVRRVYST